VARDHIVGLGVDVGAHLDQFAEEGNTAVHGRIVEGGRAVLRCKADKRW
jgi:hypothetical protein